jgi:cyclophilin family peptidyl-prolyl cis-trans isomerase
MKTWQIYTAAAAIVVVGIGLMIWAKTSTNKVADNSETTNEQTTEIPPNNTTDNINSNNSSSNSNTNTTMQEPTTQKKYVTLTIKGYGDVKIEMYEKDAPKAVENFVTLAGKGYYNGLTFHRMIPGFMIQGGDPTGTGSGGQSAFGREFEDELDPNTESAKAGYKKGVVAMANHGPNTNGSQFFIMLADYPLQHDYTIFGKVVAGQDIVDKVGLKGSSSGAPQEKIVIEKAVVSDK